VCLVKKGGFGKFVVAGILLSSFVIAQPLFALTEIEKKMQEMQDITEAISRYEKLYSQKETEERKVLGQLKQLENSLDSLEKDVVSLKTTIEMTQALLEVAQEEINKAHVLVAERTSYFNGRVQNIYQQGKVNFLEVLLQATSITDFLTRFDFMQRIANNDTKLLKELEEAKQDLLEKKAELQERVDTYYALRKQKEYKQRQMELQSRQKNNLLKSIHEQKEDYSRSMDELDEVRKGLDQFIREWQESHKEAYMGMGKMAWPLPGHSGISSFFGPRVHPIFKKKSFHAGIDIRASRGTIIQAAENGRVVYVGNKGGYGRAIIIDHGGDMSTQYSHLSAYSVQAGDRVKKGEAIGKVGSTGWSTGPHLDFIIRVKGEPQNPLNYVKP